MSYLRLLMDSSEDRVQERNRSNSAPCGDVSDEQTTDALRVLNLTGVRIIRQGSEIQVGIWEDLDCPELRAALDTVRMTRFPTVRLEGGSVPLHYKVRHCPDRRTNEPFTAYLRRAEQIQRQRISGRREVPA